MGDGVLLIGDGDSNKVAVEKLMDDIKVLNEKSTQSDYFSNLKCF